VGNKVALWMLSVLLGNVAATWFASAVLDSRDVGLSVIPPFVLAVAVALTAPGGYFSRSPQGTSPLARLVAYLLLMTYLLVSAAGASLYAWSIPVLLVSSACLALAASVLLWPTLPRKATFATTQLFVHVLLVGVAVLSIGVEQLLAGETAFGLGYLITGAVFLVEVGFKLSPKGSLWAVSDRHLRIGLLTFGGALVLAGALFLGWGGPFDGGGSLFAVAVAGGGAGLLLCGSAIRRRRSTLALGGIQLCGVSLLLVGVAYLQSGRNQLLGVATVQGSCGFLTFGFAYTAKLKQGWLSRAWHRFTTRR